MEVTPKKVATLKDLVEKWSLIIILIIVGHFGVLVLLNTQIKEIKLLKEQKEQLTQDQQLLSSGEQIYAQYKESFPILESVFPDEESVLIFLQSLEKLTRESGENGVVKFASLSPLPENDKLFLLFTIYLHTDTTRFEGFLTQLEELPYLTRVLSYTIQWSDQKKQLIDATVKLKVYVKNPFTKK
jgi:Tfp pilus assembly protein PilN